MGRWNERQGHRRRLRLATGLIALSLLSPFAAAADFDAGWRAYQKGDFQTAYREWLPLAERGDARAQYNVGTLFDEGRGVPLDRAKALDWWEKAARQNVAEAQHNLAMAYLAPDRRNPDVAKQWLEKAATIGLPKSQYTLGQMYAYGVALPQDDAKSLEWIAKAAEQGDSRAQYNLGKMYRDGTGATASLEKSVAWFTRAAKQAHPGAMGALGLRYARGEGVPKDEIQALAWLSLAARAGNAEADMNRKAIILRLNGEQIAAADKIARDFKPAAN